MANAVIGYTVPDPGPDGARAVERIRDLMLRLGFASIGIATWKGTGSPDAILHAVEDVADLVRDHAPGRLTGAWAAIERPPR